MSLRVFSALNLDSRTEKMAINCERRAPWPTRKKIIAPKNTRSSPAAGVTKATAGKTIFGGADFRRARDPLAHRSRHRHGANTQDCERTCDYGQRRDPG